MRRIQLKSTPDNEVELQQLFQEQSAVELQKCCLVLPLASVKDVRSTGMVRVDSGTVSTTDFSRAIEAALDIGDQDGIERVMCRIVEIRVDGYATSGLPIGQQAGILEVTVDLFRCESSLLERLENAASMAKLTAVCFDIELQYRKGSRMRKT